MAAPRATATIHHRHRDVHEQTVLGPSASTAPTFWKHRPPFSVVRMITVWFAGSGAASLMGALWYSNHTAPRSIEQLPDKQWTHAADT
jgi:hypothetical protein